MPSVGTREALAVLTNHGGFRTNLKKNLWYHNVKTNLLIWKEGEIVRLTELLVYVQVILARVTLELEVMSHMGRNHRT